jgi:hypothetical protein
MPLLALSDHWRVAHDGRLQWIVEQRRGRRWRGRRFHVERDALLRSIAEMYGPIDPATVATIQAWPARYADAKFNQTHPDRAAACHEPVIWLFDIIE